MIETPVSAVEFELISNTANWSLPERFVNGITNSYATATNSTSWLQEKIEVRLPNIHRFTGITGIEVRYRRSFNTGWGQVGGLLKLYGGTLRTKGFPSTSHLATLNWYSFGGESNLLGYTSEEINDPNNTHLHLEFTATSGWSGTNWWRMYDIEVVIWHEGGARVTTVPGTDLTRINTFGGSWTNPDNFLDSDPVTFANMYHSTSFVGSYNYTINANILLEFEAITGIEITWRRSFSSSQWFATPPEIVLALYRTGETPNPLNKTHLVGNGTTSLSNQTIGGPNNLLGFTFNEINAENNTSLRLLFNAYYGNTGGRTWNLYDINIRVWHAGGVDTVTDLHPLIWSNF